MKKYLLLLILLGCFIAPHAQAAITFDASSSVVLSVVSTATSSLAVGSGNEALIVCLTYGAQTVSSVTAKGGSGNLTLNTSIKQEGTARSSWMGYFTGGSGTVNATATFSAGTTGDMLMYSLLGVAGLDTTTTASATSKNTTTTLTTAVANEMTVDCLAHGSGVTQSSLGAGQTQIIKDAGSTTVVDTSYATVASAGSTSMHYTLSGSSAWTAEEMAFKPPPVITSISPTSTTAGGSNFTLTVTGTGFIASSTVDWNGVATSTTYVSSTTLTATIQSVAIASAGTSSITVVNPVGLTSNSQTFTITSGCAGSGYTWTNASGTNNWGDANNWSGCAVPGAGNVALFSASSTATTTINTSTNVLGVTITSGYTGLIQQSSGNTITVGSTGWSQAAGTFTGSSASDAITINGPFSLTGGTFTSTAGTLTLAGTSSTISGTFQNNSGLAIYAPIATTSVSITGSATFNKLQFGNASTSNFIFTIATGTTLTAQNYLYPDTNSSSIQFLGGGSINVQGNLEDGYLPGRATGTVSIVLNGSGTQIVGDDTQAGHANASDTVMLPNLTFSKTGNSIAYGQGTITVTGSSTISQGEFRVSSSTSASTFESDGVLTVSSGAILSDYPTVTSTIKVGTSVANNGLIYFDGSGSGCISSPASNYVVINSTTSGNPIAWSGSGSFVMRYVSVKDQNSTPTITVLNGTQGTDVGANWTFTSGPEEQLVQGTSGAGGSGTSSVALPAFGFVPRAGDLIAVAVSAKNQSITAPTDSAGNTYTLVASTTFGSSPSYALSLYYAKNIVNQTSSFVVTTNGTGGGGSLLSGSAFEYAGIAPSSTLDSYSSNAPPGTATAMTSLSASGQSANELFFGTATLNASTTAAAETGWTTELGVVNNTTNQALYTEDMATTSIGNNVAATWTAGTSTSYESVMGIFRSPFLSLYPASGTLDSATFDTGVASGSQLNSVMWQGVLPTNTKVGFQFAVSTTSTGPWNNANFIGPDGTNASYFGPVSPGSPQNLVSTNSGYNLFSGYRYFRYRVILFADPTLASTPTVSQVIVNWSP